jgi:glucokinase
MKSRFFSELAAAGWWSSVRIAVPVLLQIQRPGHHPMKNPLVLLADIGGTNARFALCDPSLAAPLLMDSVRQQAVAEFPTLVDAARRYLTLVGVTGRELASGVFAVAGRVDGDLAQITNHPWLISRSATREALGFAALDLINDFTAQALATELLTPQDLVDVGQLGRSPRPGDAATFAVIGPGTGLGVSALLVRGGLGFALETEGGHVGFAASTAEEAGILDFLSRDFGRVSNERLLSGAGLSNIHRALCGLDRAAALPPEAITAGASAGDPRCVRAVEVFCEIFGTVAGDLVLTLGAWDGVFLCGGLVPRLLTELQTSAFRQRFEAKGRFSAALRQVPTLAVIHPQAGLLGAAAFALKNLPRRGVGTQSAGTIRNGLLA